MVSMPERKMFSPLLGGLGVCAREGGTGVTEREMTPGSLLSFDSVRRQHEDGQTGRGQSTHSCYRASTTCCASVVVEEKDTRTR